MKNYTDGLAPCKLEDGAPSPIQKVATNSDTAAAKLKNEADPSNKIKNENIKSAEPQKRGRGRPPTHGLSKSYTYTSFREAKARCENPKHPDYERYGGRGIEFRLNSPADLIAAIGARPAGHTLDRIDPNGHYEPGNVRWATPKEQANNRNPSEYFQQQAWERKWYRSRDARELYMQAAQHWRLSVKSFNDDSKLSPEECGVLRDAHAETSIPDATFWNSDSGDSVGPGYITLPSLNHPGSRVTLRGGPFPVISFPGLEERGFVRGMNGVPLALNCTPEEISAINSFVKNFRRGDGESGLVFSGCDVVYKSNRIEGRFLAIAGRLSLHGKVRVLLAGEIATQLAADQPEKLLESEYLFIPDLEMWSAAFGSDRPVTYRLVEVLREREQRRLPTIVYAEDSPKLEPGLASLLNYRYRRVDLSKVTSLEDLSDRL